MRITNKEITVLLFILIFVSLANIFPFKVRIMGRAIESSANATITVFVAGIPPEILSYYPLTNITITEEENQTFNVTFRDEDDIELDIEWSLNDEIVKNETKEIPWPQSSNYTFVGNYSNAGYYDVMVSVSDLVYSAQLIWGLTVLNVNRPPYFHTRIPNLEWVQGSTYTMMSLDNYTTDPDVAIDDTLSYEIFFVSVPSQFLAEIDPISHEVLFMAAPGFAGSEVVYFKVTDSWGAFNYSNNVTLTVKEPPPPETPKPSGGGGGGGRVYEELCENYWVCGAWGPCDPINNTRTRHCIDLAQCPVARNKPKEVENCTYIPTCYDKIKNQNEIGIDCGGPCPSCWTCFDGIKNQDEEGIDCGGPCMDCPTCYDGKRNCQRLDKETVFCERGVDCGGPCPTDCCENEYWDDNLGEEGIDCGGVCRACMFPAPGSMMAKIIGLAVIILIIILILILRNILKKYLEKKVPSMVIRESLALKDLKRMEEGIDKLARFIDLVPNKKIVRLLSYITSRIIYYRYGIKLSFTGSELLRELSKIKREKAIRDTLMHVHSRLYHSKFSGEEIPKEDLLEFIKRIRIINNMTIRNVYIQQERYYKMLKRKNRLLIKLFTYFKKVEPEYVEKEENLLKVKRGNWFKRFLGMFRGEERFKKEKPKLKDYAVPLTFIILIVAMVFSLFIIPTLQVPKSDITVTEEGYAALIRVDEPGAYNEVARVPFEAEPRNLFERLLRWVRTVGKAAGFVYPTPDAILTSYEDENASWILVGYDDEGDYPLTFSFLAQEVATKFIFQIIPPIIENKNDTAGWVNFTPTEEYVYDANKEKSNYTVTIVVKDRDEEDSATITVMFNVTNANDAPNIPDYSPDLIWSVLENESVTFWFDNNTADPDLVHPGQDHITNEWYFDGVLNNTDESWTYYPDFCANGTYEVVLNVTDSYGLSGILKWQLEVKDLIRPPINNKSFEEDDYLEWEEGPVVPAYDIILEQFFEDVDAIECSRPTNITYGYETFSIDSVDDSELNIVINPDSSVSVDTPHDDWFGVHEIRFYGDNGARGYSNISIIFNVTNEPDPPFLDFIPNQYLVVGDDYVYDVNATDADNDVLHFSSNATIFDFDIDESTGIISFMPMTEGNYSIEIRVNDSIFTDSQIVNFTLARENFPPDITMIYPYGTPLSNTTVFAFNYTYLFPGDTTSINVTENTILLFNQTSSDPESDALTCRWYVDGSLKESNDCAYRAYWNYDVDFFQDGIRNVTLVVDDGRRNSDIFMWNVSVQNINRVPTFDEKNLTSYEDFSGATLNRTSITDERGNITLSGPYTNGTYISPRIDLKGHYDRTNIKRIRWNEARPAGTNITFRARTSATAQNISFMNWSYVYYNGSGENIIDSVGRYIQLRVEMTTNDSVITPKVESILIDYEIRSMEISGNYQAWIDLDDFFDDEDGIETLNYEYEDIFGSSILGLVIEEGSNIVGLYPKASGRAIFNFVANDSYAIAHSNNITLDVKLETPTVTVVTRSSGGGGGATIRRTKIVPVPEVKYQQLIYVESLEVLEDKTVIAPIILRNTGDDILTEIYLSAETDMENVSLRFERNYFSVIELNEHVKTNLYIKPDRLINVPYSVDVIANVTEPMLQDISIISINPLENITEKVNLVRDLLQLHPICRELEEVVIQAQEALNNNRYEEAGKLLTEVIEGCKYLVASAEEAEELRSPFVIERKWVYIIIGIIVLFLLLIYSVPKIINRMRSRKIYEYKEIR